MRNIAERRPIAISGYLILLVIIAVFVLLGPGLLANRINPVVIVGLAVVACFGFYIVQPNTAKVLTFLGNYAGTDNRDGLRWTLPFFIGRESVSLRLRNFESTQSKVNDANGNPIEIAGVVVWRVTQPAASVFGVDNAAEFVAMQSEAAIRGLASAYPYGGARDKAAGGLTLLGHPTEIASAMLQRQQADALLDAREVIVEGAVGLVETALSQLEDRSIVKLNDDQRAALVSNLMVVLSGDQKAQTVINTGAD